MGIFGFWQPADANEQLDDLIARGQSLRGQNAPAVRSNAMATAYAGWGCQTVVRDGTAVLLQGQPLVRRRGESLWRPSDAPTVELLEAYRARPDDFLSQFAGRFAVAVIDETRQRALLAVDPMGIERLTYAPASGGLVFGSSAEEVARWSAGTPRISSQAIFDYLMLHMVPAPGTIFAGVRKLRPGYYVTCENGALQERRYWQERFDETACGDFQSLRDGLHAALRTAVRDCRPGQTSGAFLSGGLDSSTVAGVLSETTPPPARTFSIGFGYPDYDELSYARIANARFGCEGHEYVVTGHDIADGFSVIARSYDEPFGNSSALPVYFCARLARECGVDHLLAGDGGDELFAGNSRYAEQAVFERYQRIPLLLRRFLLEPALRSWPLAASFGLVRKGRGYVEKANVPLPLRLEAWNFLHCTGANAILHPDFLMRVDEDATLAGMQELWDSAPGESALNRMLHYDWQYTLSDNDLRKVETMSTLAGVRVSYPMLHPDIVGLSMRVPPGMKMPGTLLRHFYKEAMAGYLPDEIIQKKKQGFGLPFGLWLKETPELRSQIDEALLSLRRREIVRADFIDRLLHLHGQEDAKYYGVFIWVLAMLEQWFREHGLSP